MDFDQFFPTEVQEVVCDCTSQVRTTVLLLTAIYVMVDYACSNKNQKEKISQLTAENATLKSVIMKSMNRTFERLMKNGNDSEDEHEE